MIYGLLSLHFLLCFMLVGLVLLQQGKGADLGATLGGGSNTLFGAGGATSFITRLTTGTAIAFMVTSLLLVRSYGALSATPGGSNTAVLQGAILQEEAATPTPTVAPSVTVNVVGTVPVAAVVEGTPAVPAVAVPVATVVSSPVPVAATGAPEGKK